MLRKAFLTGFVLIAVLWADPLAQTVERRVNYFYPQIAFEEGWKASVVVVNIGRNATNVRLLAYDASGTLVQETSGGLPLDPGERRVYSKEDGAWPEGTASLKVESDVPLQGIMLLESAGGQGFEAILPTTVPDVALTFPMIEKEPLWWSQLALLNTGAVEAGLEIVGLDSEGDPLTEGLLPTLSPMASSTVAVSDHLESLILASTAVAQVIADQSIAGLQLFGSEDREDVAALPAPLSLGQQLFLPVFQEGEGVPLWTMAGLFNPRDGPVSITVEAFDSEHRSLGELPDLTFLSPHASHLFLTPNIGGILPADTAFLTIGADQPISGYAVIGALDGQGLTALTALTENDLASDYELIGSDDGHVLAAASLVVMSDGSVESLFGNVVPGYWKVRNGLTANTGSDFIPTEILQGARITSGSSFTDDPLTSQVTPVKAVHITELHQDINTLRVRNLLPPFTFTDPTLTPGVTPIRAVHIEEMRTALKEVFDALGKTPPIYTDPTIVAGQTVIQKVHIEEIRSAVVPDIIGTYIGPATITLDCRNPAFDESVAFTSSLTISSQTGTAFSGSATLTGVILVNISLSGTVTAEGELSGTFTFTISRVFNSSGNGTFTGSGGGDSFMVNLSGQSTSGEICTWSGSISGTR